MTILLKLGKIELGERGSCMEGVKRKENKKVMVCAKTIATYCQ